MMTLESRKLREESAAVLEAYITRGGRTLRLKAWKLATEWGFSEQLIGPANCFSRELAAEILKDLES